MSSELLLAGILNHKLQLLNSREISLAIIIMTKPAHATKTISYLIKVHKNHHIDGVSQGVPNEL